MADNQLDFRAVIVNILNRWTGLKMVVEHQMGGRQSGEKALYLVEYLHEVFTSNQTVEEEDLEDLLVEYMEQEFSTELEDGSPLEVARALIRLFGVYSSGGLSAVEAQLASMPAVSEWLDIVPRARPTRQASDSDSSSDSSGSGMEEDDEWTTVRYGRKK